MYRGLFLLVLSLASARLAVAQFIYSPLPATRDEARAILSARVNHCDVYHVREEGEVLARYAAWEQGRPVLYAEMGTAESGDSLTVFSRFFTYDKDGRLRRTVTQEEGADEVPSRYDYDAAGRLKTKRTASIDPPTYTYTWDKSGHLSRLSVTLRMPVTDSAGEPTGKAADVPWEYCRYTYDTKRRMITEEQYSARAEKGSGPQYIHRWSYDAAGRVTGYALRGEDGADLFTAVYGYDDRGLLEHSEETGADGTARYVYRWSFGQ